MITECNAGNAGNGGSANNDYINYPVIFRINIISYAIDFDNISGRRTTVDTSTVKINNYFKNHTPRLVLVGFSTGTY